MEFPITASEWIRMFLLFVHLLASMFAIARVLSADLGLVSGRLSREALQATVRQTAHLLLALWASGLAIIWMDTGFDVVELQQRSKLLLKLLVVSVLTANGIILHHASFPVLVSRGTLCVGSAVLLAVSGALSTMHWMLGAFIGVSRPLGQVPFDVLLGVYLALCTLTVVTAVACVPVVRRCVLRWREKTDLALAVDPAV